MILRALKQLTKPFTGIPALKVLKDDPWFGPAPILSEKQQEYMRTQLEDCLLYTSPSPRDQRGSRMPSSA